MEKIIYCDNAASSWPKPADVNERIADFHNTIGGNPGRSGHRMSLEAGRILLDVREELARFIGARNPFSLVLTSGATHSLNIATLGLLKPGDHVIVSPFEHNSVMRPLRFLEKRGISISVLPHDKTGKIDPDGIRPLIKPSTRALYLLHSSNVTGTIQPLADSGKIAREHGIVFCVDAAGSAGAIPVNVDEMNADLVAFSGHKSLLGPQGTGALYIRPSLEKEITPVMFGGTGSRSDEEIQPDFMPDKFESGTPNTAGFAGLLGALNYIHGRGIDSVREHEIAVTRRFLDGINTLGKISVHGPGTAVERVAVVSITITDMMPSEIAEVLDSEHGIMVRPGLHCAPSAHRAMGTFPGGTVRFSFGMMNTLDEIDTVITALDMMIRDKK